MAGSGLRPLTNIPHCCLPYESGPCLSTSVGGHPLRPPTYRSLGEPLPHQQANRTHAHLLPPELSSLDHEVVRAYGALIRISSGYSPVRGRLHTRYAPVRRSQTSEDILPLDLHVLGLPLAFILSQDQTLHCKIV